MIRNFLTLTVLAIAFTACTGNAEKDATENSNATSIGATETETPEIILAEFDMKAGEYVDQEVIIAGLVDHVCKHGGKKLFLVSDDGDIHVESDERFDDDLIGSSIIVNGIVREFKVDEGYCLQMEEDNIKSHSEGDTDDELFAQKKEQVQWYRDSMMTANSDHISFYSLEYVSLVVVEGAADLDIDHENGHDGVDGDVEEDHDHEAEGDHDH